MRPFSPAPEGDGKRRADLVIPYGGLFVALLSVAATGYLALRLGNLSVAASDQARVGTLESRLAKAETRLKELEALRTQLEPVAQAQRFILDADKALAEGQQTVAQLEASLDKALQDIRAAKGRAKAKAKADFETLKAEAAKTFEEIAEKTEANAKLAEQAKVTILERIPRVTFPALGDKPAAEKPARDLSGDKHDGRGAKAAPAGEGDEAAEPTKGAKGKSVQP